MRYKILFLLLAAAIALSGCASHIEYVAHPEKGVYADYIFLNNARYIPLIKYCAYNDFEWKWDEVARTVEVRNNGSAVRLRPGSKTAIVNGATQYLENPLEMHESTLYIPLDSAKYIANNIFYIKKAPVKRVGKYVVDYVVIDPGHGGKDPGAVSPSGVREKDIVLDIAKRVKKRLEASGVSVIMTRSDDRFITLQGRTDIANSKDASLFVSIHANAARASRARGFEVYYLSEATDDLARAAEAAENQALKYEPASLDKRSHGVKATLWDLELSENRRQSKMLCYYISNIAARRLDLKSRGVKSANFYVLKGSRMPAVLVEVGFLTNQTELARLNSSSYRDELSDAIADGILAYKREFERTDGFTN